MKNAFTHFSIRFLAALLAGLFLLLLRSAMQDPVCAVLTPRNAGPWELSKLVYWPLLLAMALPLPGEGGISARLPWVTAAPVTAVLALWALLGFLSGQPLIPVCSILGQWVLGFFAAYGGRRSDLGRHDSGQILGLRSYLKHLPRDGINRLLNNDPDYFFNMAPYALALGVIRPYADAFGRRKMEDCPYLFLRTNGRKTADEWAEILRETALLMDERAKQMRFQRWFAAAAPVPKKRQRRV